MMTSTSHIGGYEVVRELTPHESWLAVGPGERRVVLKKMGEDCLARGELRPNIRQRLARVRELAHIGVANLHGVERDGALVYLVWDYLEGVPFTTAADEARGAREMTQLARKVVLAVESLHSLGIVHGALHERNVILDPTGRVRLTHISPLLYDEPAEDVRAVAAMLQRVLEHREEEDSPLGRLVAEAAAGVMSLRQLSVRLASLRTAQPASNGVGAEASPVRIRRRGLIGALVALMVGVVLAVGLWQFGRQGQTPPAVPLEADPAAMQSE